MRDLKKTTIAGAAAALFLFFSGGASAQATPADSGSGDSCRDVCTESAVECRGAAVRAHRFCLGNCEDAIEAAARGARQACLDEGLNARQCARLVKRAVAAAAKGCQQECRVAFSRARAVCADARRECHAACSPDVDPACVGECRSDFGLCREDLRICGDTCYADLEGAIQACRDSLGDVCDPGAFRECVKAARRDAHACVTGCDEQYSCSGDLRECLWQCTDPVEVR